MLDIEEQGASIKSIETSIVDVPGQVCKSLFFAGCSIRCEGCHNSALWDEKAGILTSIRDITKKLNTDFTDWIALLGGEPTDQLQACISIMKSLPNKKFCLYTGREFHQLDKSLFLPNLFLIKSGRYSPEMKADRSGVLASSNQQFLYKSGNNYFCLPKKKNKLMTAIEKL